MLTIGFLGGGNMAAALIGGLLKEKTEDLTVHVVDHHAEKLAKLEALGAKTHAEPGDWITACDLLVLAVKPQTMKAAVEPIVKLLNPKGAALSIAAGIEAGVLSGWLGGYPLMRAMPRQWWAPASPGSGRPKGWTNRFARRRFACSVPGARSSK